VVAAARKIQAASSVAFAFAARKKCSVAHRAFSLTERFTVQNTKAPSRSRQAPCRIHHHRISQPPPNPQSISSWPTSHNRPSLSIPSPSHPRVVMPPRTLLLRPALATLSLSSTIPRTSTSSIRSLTPGPSGSPSPQVERYLTTFTQQRRAF